MYFKVCKQIAHTVWNGSWDSPRNAFGKTYFSFRRSLKLQVLFWALHLHGFHAIRVVMASFPRSLWSHLMSDNRSSVSALASGSARTPSVPCSAAAPAFSSHVVRDLFVCLWSALAKWCSCEEYFRNEDRKLSVLKKFLFSLLCWTGFEGVSNALEFTLWQKTKGRNRSRPCKQLGRAGQAFAGGRGTALSPASGLQADPCA